MAVATLLSNIGGEALLGYQISSVGWLLPLVFAVYVIVGAPGTPAFPLWIWIPWTAFVLVYLLFSQADNALQRTIIMLTPIVVGIAVSKARVGELEFRKIETILEIFAIAFGIVILVQSGFALTGILPDFTSLAAQSITAVACASFFSTRYALGEPFALAKWAGFSLAPFIALTRGPMLATLLTLPLTLAPLPLWRRAVFLAVIGACGLALFHTERVQQKTFFSGSGEISDLRGDNPDLNTSGRRFIREAMEEEVQASPWLGHGANASEKFVSDLTGGTKHPHNDWLRIQFDYGYAGLIVFLITIGAQVLHALRTGYAARGRTKVFLLSGASAFVPFCILMATDNVLLYAAFFGNLHFMMLGLGYAARRSDQQSST